MLRTRWVIGIDKVVILFMVIGELAISSVALSPIYGDEVYCSVAQFDDDPFVSLLWTDWPYSLRFHPIIFSQIKERLPKMRNVATFYMAEKKLR